SLLIPRPLKYTSLPRRSFFPLIIFLLFLCSFLSHPDLHSFPTRRSSDLPSSNPAGWCRRRDRPHPARWPPRWLRRRSPASHNRTDRKSTRLNSSHVKISYAVFCLKKKQTIYKNTQIHNTAPQHLAI